MTETPKIMIGVSPRERFSVAAEAMAQLFAATPEPFRLVVIDCATPERYMKEIEAVLDGRDDVEIIRRPTYLLPNQSRNLLSDASTDDEWVCLLENDVFVQSGWLTALLNACVESKADASVPLIIEGDIDGKIHFDKRLGRIVPVGDSENQKWTILPQEYDVSDDLSEPRRVQQMIEDHCVLYAPGVIQRLPQRDEEINTREPVELAMALHSIDAKVIFEPSARVVFQPPLTINPDERDFFAQRWNRERADASRERVIQRWKLENMPSSVKFVDKRLKLLEQ
jgi:hypothetical protein